LEVEIQAFSEPISYLEVRHLAIRQAGSDLGRMSPACRHCENHRQAGCLPSETANMPILRSVL
jgi:hypothetical protein